MSVLVLNEVCSCVVLVHWHFEAVESDYAIDQQNCGLMVEVNQPHTCPSMRQVLLFNKAMCSWLLKGIEDDTLIHDRPKTYMPTLIPKLMYD